MNDDDSAHTARWPSGILPDKLIILAAEYEKDGETCTTGLVRAIIDEYAEDGWVTPVQRGILLAFILDRDFG